MELIYIERTNLNQLIYWFKSAIKRKSERKWFDICTVGTILLEKGENYSEINSPSNYFLVNEIDIKVNLVRCPVSYIPKSLYVLWNKLCD